MAVPAVLKARPKEGRAAEGQGAAGSVNITKPKMKRIAIEEHWNNKESADIRTEWQKRTGYPTTVDPQAIPYAFIRYGYFEKFRLPLMDANGITMQVLSMGSPGIQGLADASSATATAKRMNDAQAEIIRRRRPPRTQRPLPTSSKER
jgi:predicted TIM-barrel fold metal-dependent hydrolase